MDELTAAELAAVLLNFFHRLEPLKHLERTGWLDRDVPRPETVAAHTWRLAIMSWIIAQYLGLDAQRALELALVHDIAEVVTGDVTPFHEATRAPAERHTLMIEHVSESEQSRAWKRQKVANE